MGHMIPSIFPAESTSSGEKRVFEVLKNESPSDWFILHSFRLPAHRKVVFGEADFVVIAPPYGVFVLEIKSGGVGFNGTDWIFVNRFGEVHKKQRGPFLQAHDGMFEIIGLISRLFGSRFSRKKVLYGYGVIFTDTNDFPSSAITEDESWRLYQDTQEQDYCGFIKTLATNFKKELLKIDKPIPPELTASDAKEIAEALRPSVDCVIPLNSFLRQTETEILSLTTEQYSCLDDFELNERIVTIGGAGTGKTLIAAEEARRMALQNKKVLLLCYNKNLARYINSSIEPNDNLCVSSIHSYLFQICNKHGVSINGSSESFFSDELPKLALTVLNEPKCDLLIIDEFQDLCTDNYLNIFDRLLVGGLQGGNYSFFGDFSNQAIYNKQSTLENLKRRSFFAIKKLSVNCRNTINVCNELINITGFADKSYRYSITGEPVDYFVWTDEKKQAELLTNSLRALNKLGINGKRILILSPVKRKNSIVNTVDPQKDIIGDYGETPSVYAAYFETIQSFKGLESEVVIIVDINNYENKQLLYVAFSRARSKMIVLESQSAHNERLNLYLR